MAESNENGRDHGYSKKGSYQKKGGYRGGKAGYQYESGRSRSWGRGYQKRWNRFDNDPNPEGDEVQVKPSVDSEKPSKNYFWEWCESNTKKEPEEELPFEFVKLDLGSAVQYTQDVFAGRSLARNHYGSVIADCSNMHTLTEVCQFCDGGRGARATKEGQKQDGGFSRYQSGVIAVAKAWARKGSSEDSQEFGPTSKGTQRESNASIKML